MTIRERILQLYELLPEGMNIQLTREGLRELAKNLDEDVPAASTALEDLTITEAGKLVKRSASTIRGWLGRGEIPEAYRFHDREWRIPRQALEEYMARARHPQEKRSAKKAVDISEWRRLTA